jgi:hypothetical protein
VGIKEAIMALVDMKLSKKESKEEVGIITTKSEGPRYPYGLSLDLNDESMDKLGLSAKSFSVGEEVVIKAKAKIKSLRMNQYEGEDKSDSMELQITKLEVVSSDKFEEAFKEASEKEED